MNTTIVLDSHESGIWLLSSLTAMFPKSHVSFVLYGDQLTIEGSNESAFLQATAFVDGFSNGLAFRQATIKP